jgi:hypothetical protein
VTCGTSAWTLGCNLLVEAHVRFDRGDPDFELLALVDFALLELGQPDIDAIDFCAEHINAPVEPRDVLFGPICSTTRLRIELRKKMSPPEVWRLRTTESCRKGASCSVVPGSWQQPRKCPCAFAAVRIVVNVI